MRRRRPQRPEQRGVLEGGARPPLHGDGGVAGSTGSALRMSPSSRLPRSRLQARRDAPEAPPTSRTEGGSGRGGPPPLARRRRGRRKHGLRPAYESVFPTPP